MSYQIKETLFITQLLQTMWLWVRIWVQILGERMMFSLVISKFSVITIYCVVAIKHFLKNKNKRMFSGEGEHEGYKVLNKQGFAIVHTHKNNVTSSHF